MRRIFLYLLVLMAVMTACTDNDSFSTSRSCLLTFSKDTVKLDTVFSTVGSSTYTFWVYNNSGDGIRLNTVRLKNGNQMGFRVNVDGSYLDNTLGSVVTDLEVRQGDSIRVFVELTAPENQQQQPQVVEDDLLFSLESGMVQQVHLHGYAWDALMLSDLVVSSDTIVESTKPIVLYGKGIEVDSGAVLTLRGTTLYFHDKAGITVRGTLKTEQVLMRGDRLDHMFDYLPYDGVSGQWEGISFAGSSLGNELIDTEIRNAMNAVVVDSAAVDTLVQRLTMTRCIVHNAKGHGVIAYSSKYLGFLSLVLLLVVSSMTCNVKLCDSKRIVTELAEISKLIKSVLLEYINILYRLFLSLSRGVYLIFAHFQYPFDFTWRSRLPRT